MMKFFRSPPGGRWCVARLSDLSGGDEEGKWSGSACVWSHLFFHILEVPTTPNFPTCFATRARKIFKICGRMWKARQELHKLVIV